MPAEYADSFPLEDGSIADLCIVTSPEGILLGQKTRGFGTGSLVLPGGKGHFNIMGNHGVNPYTSLINYLHPVINTRDEVAQETGLTIDLSKMRQVGQLLVEYSDKYGDLETRGIDLIQVNLGETPELGSPAPDADLVSPTWYPIDDLPYNRMPRDYELWLPHVLSGHLVTAFLVSIETDFKGSQIFLTHQDPSVGQGHVHSVYDINASQSNLAERFNFQL